MGVVFDPELYRATEKHFAPYPLPVCSKSKWQTWHTDAVFDNGYYATAMYAFTGPLRSVLLQIVDNTGKIAVESIQFYEAEDVVFDPNGYDISVGENYFRANFPNLALHVRDEERNAGLDLLVETEIMPTISELPDGVGIGRVKAPNMPVSVAWFFLPWNKITGTLTVDGQEIRVTGQGWSDHQYGTDDFFTKACHYFIWGNFPLGEHTLTTFEAQGGAAQGYRNFKWVWDFKGDKLYSYDRNADVYIYTSDIEEGDTIPKTVVFVYEGDRIRGKITCKWKTLIQKQPVDCPPLSAMLNRSAYDCHAEMCIDGVLIDKTFVRILEIAYTLDPVAGVREAQPVERIVEEIIVEEEIPFIDESIPARLTIKSKLGKVIKDPEGNAVLEKYVPGITNDPNTKLGYGMTLKMLFSMPQTGVSKATLAKIDTDLRKIK